MKALPPGWKENHQMTLAPVPLAVQLFTVADMLEKDLRGTLKQVKAAGYDAVEFFGGLKYAAQDVYYAIKEAGLQIAGWHTPWEYLSPEFIHSTITYNKVLGNQFIIVPWRPDEVLATRESCLRFARELTWVSDVLAMYGMVTGYHNHTAEFRPTADTGELPWDIIAQNTPSTVIMQNDIGNGMYGGGDMMGLLKKYPGRAGTVHIKPFSPTRAGTFFDDPECVIDWNRYFEICRAEAGVRWYIIEYMDNERFPEDPMGALRAAAMWFRGATGSYSAGLLSIIRE
ncbi:MAG: sugar phosphate isomerase/epimerase [Defluviitaleaceae bacterium]|nr:sugar phosphate isomerase/epimerase [Defluviitaleaceae bacterium]